MLAHNLRRWPNIKPALVQGLVFVALRSTQYTQSIVDMCPLWSVLECFENLRNYRDTLKQVPKFPSSGNYKFPIFKFRELQAPKFQY